MHEPYRRERMVKHGADERLYIFCLATYALNVAIWALAAGKVFQHIVGIPMGKLCIPFLADIFQYSYRADKLHLYWMLAHGKVLFFPS